MPTHQPDFSPPEVVSEQLQAVIVVRDDLEALPEALLLQVKPLEGEKVFEEAAEVVLVDIPHLAESRQNPHGRSFMELRRRREAGRELDRVKTRIIICIKEVRKAFGGLTMMSFPAPA